jgi:hypothetical protein
LERSWFWKTDIFLTTGRRRGFLVHGDVAEANAAQAFESILYGLVYTRDERNIESDGSRRQPLKWLKTAMEIPGGHGPVLREGSHPARWTEKSA